MLASLNTPYILLSATSALSSFAAPPPLDPIPPTTNSHNYYSFGAQDDGATGEPGRPPSLPKSGHGSGAESNAIGPHDCRMLKDDVQVCTPVKGSDIKKVSPAELALVRWARMPIPAPKVRTAPPRRSEALVGLPEWFWVTNWRAVSGRAAARGVWVEVTARPQRLVIEPGDGHQVECRGPGTAYKPSRPASSQRTDCSYTFPRSSAHEPGGAYRVRVSVTWGGTWRGSGGAGGVLPPLTRSRTFPMPVAEAQGLYG